MHPPGKPRGQPTAEKQVRGFLSPPALAGEEQQSKLRQYLAACQLFSPPAPSLPVQLRETHHSAFPRRYGTLAEYSCCVPVSAPPIVQDPPSPPLSPPELPPHTFLEHGRLVNLRHAADVFVLFIHACSVQACAARPPLSMWCVCVVCMRCPPSPPNVASAEYRLLTMRGSLERLIRCGRAGVGVSTAGGVRCVVVGACPNWRRCSSAEDVRGCWCSVLSLRRRLQGLWRLSDHRPPLISSLRLAPFALLLNKASPSRLA